MRVPDLARIHLQLRYRVGDDGSLAPFSEELDPAPRLLVVRQPDATRAYFGHRAPERARRRVREIGAAAAFAHPDELAGYFRGADRGRWDESVLFRLRAADSGDAAPSVSRHGGHFVVLDDGRPVAWAWSVRAHGLAEEGAVETVPAFRRRGLGREVLRAWTSHVVRSGKIAFYPVDAGDVASIGLAASLEAQPLATVRSFP